MLGKREVGLSEFKLVTFLQVSVNVCKNAEYFGRNVFLSKRKRKSQKNINLNECVKILVS